MKYISLILLITICSFSGLAQDGKKVQYVGGARSLITNSNFNSDGDTTTVPRHSGGNALLDLGFKINPNANTEILGMVRINNEFGGFWGGGVTFDVRQLYVRGVAGGIVRYQIGNINYKLSPYTFYNHNQDIRTSSIGTNKIKEDVLNYESFYKDNTWRQQGASANFGLQFPKVIQEIEFNGFIARLNPTNFSSVLERLYGGGNTVITQSKHLTLGVNHVSVFDLNGTALDSNIYKNNVSSITYDVQFMSNDNTYGLDGESGIGLTSQSLYPEGDLTDYFVHARLYLNLTKSGLKLNIGYMDNGPDFRSFGAQSKRVNFNQENNFYNRYTNSQVIRPISMYDMYNDPGLYNEGITVGVMDYNPLINTTLPYGIASFNRRGGYLGVNYSDKNKTVEAEGKLYFLSEIRGQGTTHLKSFLMGELQTKLNAEKIWKGDKEVTVQLGITHQQSTRKGEFDFQTVDLNSTVINLGIEGEIIDNLFLMGNVFTLQAFGSDQLTIRDSDDIIINYEGYEIDGSEMNISGGLRLDFSKKIYLAGMYEWNTFNLSNADPYSIQQVSLFYVMKF